jgi:hypothetical protein
MITRGCLRSQRCGSALRAIGIGRNGARGENHSVLASSAALNHSSVVILRPVALFSRSSVAVPTRSPAKAVGAALASRSMAINDASAGGTVFMSAFPSASGAVGVATRSSSPRSSIG